MGVNLIKKRIESIQGIMKKEKVDIYAVFTGDYHLSEYVGDYFKERDYLSGFTGSAGEIVITQNDAMLFTDGRYFVQAEKQLKGSDIQLMKMGTADAVSIYEYCKRKLPVNGVIGFDGKTVSAYTGKCLSDAAKSKNGRINPEINLTERIWQDRPRFPKGNIEVIEAGESCADKLKRIRENMKKDNCDKHIIASLDDICWIYNIRGNCVACNPVVMAYSVITIDSAFLYLNNEETDSKLKKYLSDNNVVLKEYDNFYDDIKNITNSKVLLDRRRANYYLGELLDNSDNVEVIDRQNPSVYMKSIKNEYEINNLKKIHIEDGLAVFRFMHWLKKEMPDGTTEYEAACYMDECRKKIKDYKDLSFDTICAYGENAAMLHYHADKADASVINKKGMLLVDSGGQYERGTTDITRTYAMGEVSDEMKKYYTLTLKGMLSLADARFLKGCTGYNLDILARQALWEQGIDYRCGTGHGVGYRLNVHEAPNGFRWKHVTGVNDLCVIEPGMVTTDEPGVYIDGEFGIRIENELLCVEDMENEYGTFLKFIPLTCAPVDLELIDEKFINELDKKRLNEYHMWVRRELGEYVKPEEKSFLYKVTEAI